MISSILKMPFLCGAGFFSSMVPYGQFLSQPHILNPTVNRSCSSSEFSSYLSDRPSGLPCSPFRFQVSRVPFTHFSLGKSGYHTSVPKAAQYFPYPASCLLLRLHRLINVLCYSVEPAGALRPSMNLTGKILFSIKRC